MFVLVFALVPVLFIVALLLTATFASAVVAHKITLLLSSIEEVKIAIFLA